MPWHFKLKLDTSAISGWGATTLSITTFSIITTLGKWSLHVTLSISDTQHNNALPLCWVSLCWVLCFIYCYDEYHYVECHYAECRCALGEDCKNETLVCCSVWNKYCSNMCIIWLLYYKPLRHSCFGVPSLS